MVTVLVCIMVFIVVGGGEFFWAFGKETARLKVA